jgi:hypothetical protein
VIKIFNRGFSFFLLLTFVISSIANSQNFTLSGKISDQSNGEAMIGATIYIKEINKAFNTNNYGFYSITIPKGNYTVIFNFTGYSNEVKNIQLIKDLQINISLKPQEIQMDEVQITGEKSDKNVSGTQMGTVTLDMELIKTLPQFMGEVDVLKTIQLIPGVKSSGDGQTGFYVRGGGPDQNLILLDEGVVYNASHLMGFFSVFNGDAIKNVTLVKGGMPAQYGNRLSSVLDIQMKEGNNQRYEVNGGIGVISSRLTVQGPIKKDTSSFIFSMRRTYIDALIKPFFKAGSSPFAGTSYHFYDLNGKLNFLINDKNKIYFSGYFGRDVFRFNDSERGFNVDVPWGNSLGSFRWNHIFNKKLFSNTSLIYSYYDFSFGANQDDFEFKLFSGIRDWNLKQDYSWFANTRHDVKFGWSYTFHTFIPTNVSAKQGETKFDFGDIVKLYAHDAQAYISDDWEITDYLKIHSGLRFSYFAQIGPFTRFTKDELNQTTGSIKYKNGEKVADYNGLEPRASIRWTLSKSSSIKASYTRNYQYIHLASISSVSLPTDVWMPCTEIIKPQIGNQYALGYFKNFNNDLFETSVEVYYKDMQNLIEYKDGAQPQDNVFDNPDNSFTFGKGRAYGAEFFVKKRSGKLTGWIGYTLSWTKRQFADINFGQEFYAKYDRRHDASVVLTYDLNKRWNFSTIWVYGTGNAGTLPNSLALFEGDIMTVFGLRNSYRFQPYHRLDISATYTPDRKKQIEKRKAKLEKKYARLGKDISKIQVPKPWCKHYESSWAFSVFNVYNRMNPYFIYFDREGDFTQGTFKVSAKQVSLFPVLPSVTWNFKF